MNDPQNLLNYKCPYYQPYASSREEIPNHTVYVYAAHGKRGFKCPKGDECNWVDGANVSLDKSKDHSLIKDHLKICHPQAQSIERRPLNGREAETRLACLRTDTHELLRDRGLYVEHRMRKNSCWMNALFAPSNSWFILIYHHKSLYLLCITGFISIPSTGKLTGSLLPGKIAVPSAII
jgi:hypothetical protein